MGIPREWSFELTSDGWVLTVDPLLPQTDSKTVWYYLMLTFLPLVAVLQLAQILITPNPDMRVFYAVRASVLAALFAVLLLPQTRRLLVRSSQQRAIASNGHLETADGIFLLSELQTLRIAKDGADPGRSLLQFTSHSMSAADLVGWPGIRDEEVDEVLGSVMNALDRPSGSSGC